MHDLAKVHVQHYRLLQVSYPRITLLFNCPVDAQVGHASSVVNRVGLSFNMEEERIVCDP